MRIEQGVYILLIFPTKIFTSVHCQKKVYDTMRKMYNFRDFAKARPKSVSKMGGESRSRLQLSRPKTFNGKTTHMALVPTNWA